MGDKMLKYEDVLEYWQSKKISSVSELETAINGKIISLAYHSGKIENSKITYNDTREIFEHDRVVQYTGDLRTLFEIRNSKDAFIELLGAYEKNLPSDNDLICKFQYELTKNTYDKKHCDVGERPGKFKVHDYVVGQGEVGAFPEDVPPEMAELLKEISDYSGKEILKVAAYFHLKFENIHPFSDGNGRTGRFGFKLLFIAKKLSSCDNLRRGQERIFSGVGRMGQ
jgi:Fic family protein